MPKSYSTPGPRAIYPDMCTSRDLAACSIEAQLLFDRLITQADDQGRLEGSAIVIKALCVPLLEAFTTRRVTLCLGELAREDLITLYAVGHFPHLVQLRTWWRWQAGQRRAYPSKWPPPPDWQDPVYGHGDAGPKTYRQAVGLDPYERPRKSGEGGGDDQSTPQEVGTNSADKSAESPLSRARPAQPLPLPSAGATATAEIPPPPAERGRRSTSTNPRANGTAPRDTGASPRANGRSPRQEREALKRGPTPLGAILAEAASREAKP